MRGLACGGTVLLSFVAVLSGLLFSGQAAAGSGRLIKPVEREFVAVAYLDPELVVDVNVVTGRFRVSSEALFFRGNPPAPGYWEPQLANQPEEIGVMGIWDPIDHRLYRYQGGNPGFTAAGPQPAGAASLPAPGHLPVWSAPRIASEGPHVRILALPDGRRITIRTDGRGRTTSVSWPGFPGGRLVTRIRYSGALTSIADPFGTTRTYEHNTSNHAFEVVPRAWQGGAGYRGRVGSVLDDERHSNWVQNRAIGPQGDLLNGLGRVAGRWFAGLSFDSPANAGYINVGLTSLAAAGRVLAALKHRGLLDIGAILPAHTTAHQLTQDQNSLQRPLTPAERDCHALTGQTIDAITISVATTITRAEVRAMDRAIRRLDTWVLIERHGTNECATF